MNMKFGKLAMIGGVEYAPNPAIIVTHHHEEWDKEKFDENGEPTGETEHKTADWDERKLVYNPNAEQYLRSEGGQFYEIVNNPPEPREGFYPVRGKYVMNDTGDKIITEWSYEPIKRTEADFDAAMENHIRRTREERGYTTREPSEYISSSVPRWAQDAADFIRFRDEVMVYGLTILNEWKRTGIEPSYDEFVANLPKIKWTEA